jgi:hypothetical protein
LRPGGHLLLGCDVYSWAGLMKYRIRVGAASVWGISLIALGDVAHPHRFLAADLENLVLKSGLKILSTNARHFDGVR